jgi:hypothetical protein
MNTGPDSGEVVSTCATLKGDSARLCQCWASRVFTLDLWNCLDEGPRNGHQCKEELAI